MHVTSIIQSVHSLSPTKTTTSTIDKATGLDRANLTIAVKNGSGVTGAAAKASNFLKDLGYTVSSTGNADNSDYENTVIEVKSTNKTEETHEKRSIDFMLNSYFVGMF